MRKNQISQAISSPTSKTRKPTMKIHPSVDIDFDGNAEIQRRGTIGPRLR